MSKTKSKNAVVSSRRRFLSQATGLAVGGMALGALSPTSVSPWGVRSAHATEAVGNVEEARYARFERPIMQDLRAGASIGVGDRIVTDTSGRAKFGFNDGTELTVGEMADFVVDEFVYGEPERQPGFHLAMARGAFRYLSGAIGKAAPQNVALDLPVATIGIRGTHILALIEEDMAGCIVLLPDPRNPDRPSAFSVSAGGKTVVVDKVGWGTDVPGIGAQPTEPSLWDAERIGKMEMKSGGFSY